MQNDQHEKLQQIGRGAYASIAEMVANLAAAEKQDGDAIDAARCNIIDDALSVEVRSGWTSVGETLAPQEYCILLSTGGPATRIVGDLGRYGEPETARLEAQDWFLPWTEYHAAEEDVLLDYARCFYFGE